MGYWGRLWSDPRKSNKHHHRNDAEEIHPDIYEHFGIIPIIIRKKMVYPKWFTKDGFPLCPWGTPMNPKGIEYDRNKDKIRPLQGVSGIGADASPM